MYLESWRGPLGEISYLQTLVGNQVLGGDPLARLIGPADAELTARIPHQAV